MPSRFKRAVIGSAAALGYVPTGDVWRDRLQALSGEFRRSTFDKVFRYFMVMFCFLGGAFLFGDSCSRYVRLGAGDALYFIGVSLFIMAAGLYGLSQVGVWYRFQHGLLTAFRGWRLLWREDLSGLRYVLCARGRGTAVMTLVWADHKRRMQLFASLEAVLSGRHRG